MYSDYSITILHGRGLSLMFSLLLNYVIRRIYAKPKMLYFYVISDGLRRLRRGRLHCFVSQEKSKGDFISCLEIVVYVLYCLCQKICTILEIGDIKHFHR